MVRIGLSLCDKMESKTIAVDGEDVKKVREVLKVERGKLITAELGEGADKPFLGKRADPQRAASDAGVSGGAPPPMKAAKKAKSSKAASNVAEGGSQSMDAGTPMPNADTTEKKKGAQNVSSDDDGPPEYPIC